MKNIHYTDATGYYFSTLRLRDALPESFGQNLRLQYYSAQMRLAGHPQREVLLQQTRKRLFQRYEQQLLLEQGGIPLFRSLSPAKWMAEVLRKYDAIRGFAILPNHLQVLTGLPAPTNAKAAELESLPCPPLRQLLSQLQADTEAALCRLRLPLSETSNAAAFQLIHKSGVPCRERPLWHSETFDFYLPHRDALKNAVQHLLHSAVKAPPGEECRDWPYLYLKSPVLRA